MTSRRAGGAAVISVLLVAVIPVSVGVLVAGYALSDGTLVIAGGKHETEPTSTTYVLRPAGAAWVKDQPMPFPQARMSGRSAIASPCSAVTLTVQCAQRRNPLATGQRLDAPGGTP